VDGAPSGAVKGTTSSCQAIGGSCSANPSSVVLGSPVNWTVTPSGATGNYKNYQWVDSLGTVTHAGPSVTDVLNNRIYSAVSTQTMQVTFDSVLPLDGTPYSLTNTVSCSADVTASCTTGTPTVDLKFDGSNGPVNMVCGSNTDRTISWTTTNMPGGSICTVSGKDTWVGSKSGSTGNYTQSSGAFTSDTILNISCSSCAGVANDSVEVNLTGGASDFALNVLPQTIRVKQLRGVTGEPYSESTTVTVSVAGCSSFNSPVDLTLQENSIGGVAIDAIFNSAGNDNRLPQAEYGTGATLKIKASNPGTLLPVGTYDVHVIGTEVGGSAVSHNVLVHLIVESIDPPSFNEI
jgi:hypothetical protein